ncbi:Panacea domain-containing protein [Actinotignum sp. GS-2025a]|uniref:Panacea domain-containing protein n=1 Tax=Actinotignum sp. GS-2025a TaxID=3427274 RepID=UPI003F45481C
MVNVEKYENTILFLAATQEDDAVHGSQKLASLLYYADFDRFEYKESMVSITGDTYRNRRMGPAPEAYLDIAKGMAERGLLAIAEEDKHTESRPAVVYKVLREPDMSVFDEGDRVILERVRRTYSRLSGAQLEALSRREAPWAGASLGESIPYEAAFYRGTNFDS